MPRFGPVPLCVIVLAATVVPCFGLPASALSPSLVSSNQSVSARRNAEAILKLEELTDANAAQLLLGPGAKSFVVVYSSKEYSPAQSAQLDLIARDSHNYTGVLGFYRLDQAKYPRAWSAISHNVVWNGGPRFLLIDSQSKITLTSADNKGVALHQMSSELLSAEIKRFFKILPPVFHATVDDVDRLILQPGLPTFIMAYRNRGPQNITTQFQRFGNMSQLYAGRVHFLLVDLDQGDLSPKLGFTLPKQDDPYYVLYNPKGKVGLLINNPLLSESLMEDAIRSYFGPGHEPAKVIP